MTTAPGSSPSSRRLASGRMSTTRSPAANARGEVGGLDPLEAGPGRGEQVVDGHRSIVAASGRRVEQRGLLVHRLDALERAVGQVEAHRAAAAASRRGCSSCCGASGCRRRASARTARGRTRRRGGRRARATRSTTAVSVSSPSTTTNAPLASPWSCRPTDWPGVHPSSQTSYAGVASSRRRTRSSGSWATCGRHSSSARARPLTMSASTSSSRRTAGREAATAGAADTTVKLP